MGKPTGKKKNQVGSKPNDSNLKRSNSNKGTEKTSKAIDEDTAVFINMSQELKEEGNKLFQKHDHEGAMLSYEKAIKLLPRNHIDVAYLRSNMAACYMQMGIGEYPRAIHECNLALEVSPKYSKALLKRAKCYEALNKLDFAFRDVCNVLSIEPNNLTALEIEVRLRKVINEKGLKIEGQEIGLPDDYVEPVYTTFGSKVVKGKSKRKKCNKKKPEDTKIEKKKVEVTEEKKVVVEEKRSVKEEKALTKMVKLILGEDIRWAEVPVNCSVRLVRDIVLDRFPNLKGALIKYKDQEGDLVTITTNDELRLAEKSGDPRGFLRLYVAEISPDREPIYEEVLDEEYIHKTKNNRKTEDEEEVEKGSTCVEDWIVQFACIFKNHVGFECDSYLDLHEIGMKLYSEAMEDTVTSEDAQDLFDLAAEKFQEMTALALFNWGNVHMARARKRVNFPEDASGEALLERVKISYDYAHNEYVKAGKKYEEAVKVKPDFYEGLIALGQQLFEQAKLSWYYAIGTKVDLDTQSLAEVLEIYNKAEDNMEKGMEIWETMEEEQLNGISKYEKYKAKLEKFGLDGLFNDDLSVNEGTVRVNMKSQIYLLWGTLLYERSVVEFKLNLPTWEECVEVAVEKFELAGAPATDITVMIKNHCSSETALEGFKVDEIVQAWSEMYDTDKWQIGGSSSRLESLFRRRVPKILSILEHL